MNENSIQAAAVAQENWLVRYYFARAAVAIAWVGAVLGLVPGYPNLAAALLILYPAWDALANLADAHRSGGIRANRSQAINAAVSFAVTAAIAFALPDMHRVLGVFGAWAILAGVLQLATALQRWKRSGAQWAMVLSGAQSALAGAVFIFQASAPAAPTITTVVGYAGFGAFYFLLSALLLTIRARRRMRVP